MASKKTGKAPKVVQLTKELNWYGFKSAVNGKVVNQLEVELGLFCLKRGSLIKRDGTKNKDGIARWKHAKNAIDIIWNYQGSKTPFAWHPDALRMIKALCKHKRLAISGAGSTGKSDMLAVWALIKWLSKPYKNIVLVNTTTLKDAQLRIWGKIVRYYSNMIVPPPGKLVASAYAIKSVHPKTQEVSEEFGIRLFAGEQSKAAESSRAIRGVKHSDGGEPVVILDEMPELSNAIMATFDENLTQNPNHSIVGLGNPNSPYDTFGQFCEPKEGGWKTYSEEWKEWQGVGGYVIRLNAEESLNILEGRTVYGFLMTQEMLMEKRERLGEKSRAYYRGVLGAFLLEADDETIYSPAELMRIPDECVWANEKEKCGGFDNAFTAGGDRSILYVGEIGICTDGKRRLKFTKFYSINEDAKNTTVDRTTQIIKELRRICEKEGIKPKNLSADATAGGGKTFCDAMWSQWSNEVLRVDFGGKASDRPVSSADREKSSVRYANRVSELWANGKELIRCDNIRGIGKELAEEMVARRYKDNKALDGGSRIKVESKIEMKRRTMKSPDIADAAFCLVELCRERHKLSGDDKPGNYSKTGKTPMKKRFSALSSIYNAA